MATAGDRAQVVVGRARLESPQRFLEAQPSVGGMLRVRCLNAESSVLILRAPVEPWLRRGAHWIDEAFAEMKPH